MEAKQTPLIELLESVPQNARCRVDEPDGMGSVFIPVGRLCHEAAAALAQQAEPVQRKPLTDEKIANVYIEWDKTPGASMADYARAIERAHGIGGPE